MRIDLYGSAAQAAASGAEPVNSSAVSASGKAASQPNAALQETDRTTLSSSFLSVDSLTRQALASGAARSERVGALRQSVNNGDYKLEPDAIAQSVLRDRA